MKTYQRWFQYGFAVVLLAAGCQPSESPRKESAVPTASEPPAHAVPVDPRQIAKDAKEEMFKGLSARLLEAMSNGGPTAAIEVCSKDAPRIADRVGKQFGIQIGRTSFKLRNPKNGAPEWVRPLIENKPTEPTFVELPDDHTGALFPIALKVQCLVCHGPKEQISEDVQKQLDHFYPEDQATGFNEGDLRGWFWVDVPSQNQARKSSESSQ